LKKTSENMDQYKRIKTKLEAFSIRKDLVRVALDKALLHKKILENSEENVVRDDVQELMEQVKDYLYKTESLSNCRVIDCKADVINVDAEGAVYKVWTIIFKPDDNHPEVIITQEIATKDKPGSEQLPMIQSLRLSVEGLDTDFTGAKVHCEEEKEPQLFTDLVIAYIDAAQERRELIETYVGSYCHLRPPNKLELFNRTKKSLAMVTLSLKMDLREKSGWKLSWAAVLTDVGREACAEFHLPRSLVKRGRVDDWTPSYALESLTKLASLAGQSPEKENSAVQSDRPSPRGETPKAETKRAKQRKLNM